MAKGHPRDPEWRMTLIFWSPLGCVIMSCGIVWVMLYQSLAYATVMPADKFPTHGFWLVGNQSFFTPSVANRTDMNESSPTYLRWTPPPGAPLSLHEVCKCCVAEDCKRFLVRIVLARVSV